MRRKMVERGEGEESRFKINYYILSCWSIMLLPVGGMKNLMV